MRKKSSSLEWKEKKEETKQQDKDKSTALLSWIASLQVA